MKRSIISIILSALILTLGMAAADPWITDGSTATARYNLAIPAAYTLTSSGTVTAEQLTSTDDITATGTITGEQIDSTDDMSVAGDLAVTGAISAGLGTISSGVYDGDFRLAANHSYYSTAGSGKIDLSNATGLWKMPTGQGTIGGLLALNDNVTVGDQKRLIFGVPTSYIEYVAGNYMSIKGNPQMDDGFTWAGTASPASGSDLVAIGSTSDINYTLSSGIFASPSGTNTLRGDTTVSTNKALAVTTADKLTVGGNIIPQEMAIPFTYTASSVDVGVFSAKGAWNITGVELVPRVVGGDASPVNVTVKVCDSGEAPASGVAALSAVLDLKGTADTTQSGTLSADVACTSAQYIALDFTGTMTSAVGSGTIWVKRV